MQEWWQKGCSVRPYALFRLTVQRHAQSCHGAKSIPLPAAGQALNQPAFASSLLGHTQGPKAALTFLLLEQGVTLEQDL